MSVIQHLVSPALPTALAAQTHVDLPGYDLWLHLIDNVHVLPTDLNIPRFEEALSKVLKLYPHAAGQLRYSNGRWSIQLANKSILVDIEYRLDAGSNSLLDGDWVIQDDISPFLSHQPTGTNLINGGTPLVRFKLTFFDDETCIGVSWHHTLGDAVMLSRFMHTLSQFYQGLPSEYAAPTFKKHDFPKPSHLVMDEFWPRMPHLHNTRPIAEVAGLYAEMYKDLQHLRWRFDIRDIAELHSALSEEEGTYLSKQDCLTAYLVTVLNYNRIIPIRTVSYASSFRQISAPFIAQDVAGNQLQNFPVTVPMGIAGIATAIRQTLAKSRKPDHIHNWVSLASSIMLEAANANESYFFRFPDDMMGVNSNTTIDWCSAHFGFPAGSRFHMSSVSELFARWFRSNPTKGDDGTWKTRQSVEVSMGVTAELKPKLLKTLAYGIQHILDNERAQS